MNAPTGEERWAVNNPLGMMGTDPTAADGAKSAFRPLLFIQFIILMFVYTGFSAATGQLSQDKDLVLRFFAACALLHLVLLGANTLLSGALKLQWPDRTALILCGSQKTLPNGIYVWSNFFATNPYGAVPLVLYHLFQLLVDTLLVPWFEKQN